MQSVKSESPKLGEKEVAQWNSTLCFDDTEFLYDPFPIGLSKCVFPQLAYRELVQEWPPIDLFQHKENLGHKYSLSEVNNSKQYHAFLQSCRPWLNFYQYVKSSTFICNVLELLCKHHIDLGLRDRRVSLLNHFSSRSEKLRALTNKLWKFVVRSDAPLNVRFEFSMLPADRGCIKPHTDAPQKLITLVLSMMPEGEWDDSFGGGTAILRPRDLTRNFNHLNKQFEFHQMETIRTFPFVPNQCVLFIKTFNSWHAVAPMTGYDSKLMRKTLTINIESWGQR